MLEVRLFGRFEILRNGARLTIPTRNGQALFAYLAMNEGVMHRREQLAGLLWPDSSEENARSNLRHELWRLRKALESEGDSLFQIDDLAISFSPHPEILIDVRQLEYPSLEKSSKEDLIQSLNIYRGELLPGFYEEWIFVERSRLHALFETKMTRLLQILEREQRWSELLEWSMRWITVEQWSEPAYRALIIAYANSGDLAKAAAAYERFRQGLQKDLGVKPSEQTQALYKQLKAGWKSDDRTVDSRAHYDRPANAASEITVVPQTLPRTRRSNLPRPLTSFVGREKEIRQIERLVANSRLVTVTGSGGVGKTRLAIQAAATLAPLFQDGVWWVELASLFDIQLPDYPAHETGDHDSPGAESGQEAYQFARLESIRAELIAREVVKNLRLPEMPEKSSLEALNEYLCDKELLLILDNCEHLIKACAALVEIVLNTCDNVVLLVTSREALGVPGEIAWFLPSLSLPERGRLENIDHLAQSEAIRLFLERANDILPHFKPSSSELSTIAQICIGLDGIPLAIELAAARTNLLSVHEIAARLGSRFNLLTGGYRTALPRHQTLRGTIEWSYDLLNEPESVLFRRLSVFATSFTLRAAESICDERGIHKDDVLALLGRLVDKSLLQVESDPQGSNFPTRYRLLNTICSFARLKLDDAGETDWLRERHAEYFVALVEAAEPELLQKDQMRWFELLQAENDNLRAVIEWSVEKNQPEVALRLVGSLMWFWFSNGSSREGSDLTNKALSLHSAVEMNKYRAKALNTAGLMQCYLGDIDAARRSLEEALTILRSSFDEPSLAWTLQIFGLVYAFDGNFEMAGQSFREGLEINRKLGGINQNNFLHFLGDVELQKGDRVSAKKIYEESAKILKSIGSKSFLAYPLRRLGYLALDRGEIATAWEYFRESLALNQEIGDQRGIIAGLVSAASLALRNNQPVLAAQLFGSAEQNLETLSLYLHYVDQNEVYHLRDRLLAVLDEVTFTSFFSEGWEMSVDQAIALAQNDFQSLGAAS